MPVWPYLHAMLAFAAVFGQTSYVKPHNELALPDDPRLEKTVSGSFDRITVAELLEAWSKQTGVPLTVDERTQASGAMLTVHLQQTPLKGAMTALWSLLSYQDATWDWGAGARPAEYRFGDTYAVRQFPARIAEEAVKSVEQEAEVLLAASRMTPDERRKLASHNPLLAQNINDSRIVDEERVFGDALTPEQRIGLLRDGGSILVPIASLPMEDQLYVRTSFESMHMQIKVGDGPYEPAPMPVNLKFEGTYVGNTLRRCIWATPVFGSFCGMANTDIAFNQYVASLWMLPDDQPTDVAEQRVLKLRPAGEFTRPDAGHFPAVNDFQKGDLPIRLDALCQDNGISSLALAPSHRSAIMTINDPENSKKKRPAIPDVKLALDMLEQTGYIHKWRNGLLLMSDPTWVMDTEGVAPYALYRRLKEEVAAQGIIPLRTLIDLAVHVPTPQLMTLDDLYSICSRVARNRSLLALADRIPGLAIPTGTPITPEILAAAKDLRGIPSADVIAARGATRARLSMIPSHPAPGEKPIMLLEFELTDESLHPVLHFVIHGQVVQQ